MKKIFVNNKYNIPPFLLWPTIILCITPTLLNWLGVDFGYANTLINLDDINTLNEIASNHKLHPLLAGKFIHTILVTFSISIAFLTVILAFIDYFIKKDISTPIVGVALFCASMLDVVHIFGADWLMGLNINTSDITSFTWLFSRTFHALILILGVGIFLIQRKESVGEEYRGEKNFVIFISTIFVLLAVNAILIVTDESLKIPQMSYPTNVISHPYDLIPLTIYIIAGIYIFPAFYKQNPSTFSQTLILSLIPAIVTQLHMAIGSKEIFDNHFYIAHFMKSVSYFIPFLGLGLNYLETHRSEKAVIKKLDAEIHEKEKVQLTLKGVLDSSLNGIMAYKAVRDINNKIIDFEWTLVNPASLRMNFFKDYNLVGKSLLQNNPSAVQSGLFSKYVQVVEQGKPMVFEQHTNENNHYFNISVVKLGDGIAVTFDDVTERKANEQKIQKSEGLYRALAKHIPDSAVFLFDHDLKLTLVDGTSLKHFELDKDVIINQAVKDVINQEARELFIPLFKQALAGKQSEVDYFFNKKYFHVSIIPIKNSEGELFAGMAVTHDITAIKEYQKQLEQKIEDLNRSNKELEQFAYVASHDLQEPLRKIQAFGDRLQSKFHDKIEGDGKLYIDRMQNAASRMQVLIDDLLTFSRISRPKEKFTTISLSKIIRGVINDLEISIEQTRAIISITELPDIQAIPGQLRQLFQNIISNAIKFRKENTQPKIEVTSDIITGSGIEGLDSSQKYCKIQIKDNGIGFDEKYLDRIFIIFQRLHGRTEYEGTGIGLAICKKIVEAHHGIISAQSIPNEGSKFTIILPLKQLQYDE